MPIDLIINKKVSEGLYMASGSFSNDYVAHFGELFVKQDAGEVRLFNDEAHTGKIANMPVEYIAPHEPVLLDDIEIGTRLNFRNVHVTLKKQ